METSTTYAFTITLYLSIIHSIPISIYTCETSFLDEGDLFLLAAAAAQGGNHNKF